MTSECLIECDSLGNTNVKMQEDTDELKEKEDLRILFLMEINI